MTYQNAGAVRVLECDTNISQCDINIECDIDDIKCYPNNNIKEPFIGGKLSYSIKFYSNISLREGCAAGGRKGSGGLSDQGEDVCPGAGVSVLECDINIDCEINDINM